MRETRDCARVIILLDFIRELKICKQLFGNSAGRLGPCGRTLVRKVVDSGISQFPMFMISKVSVVFMSRPFVCSRSMPVFYDWCNKDRGMITEKSSPLVFSLAV